MDSKHNSKHAQFQTDQASSSVSNRESKPKCICPKKNPGSQSREGQMPSRIPKLQSRAPQYKNVSREPLDQVKISSGVSNIEASKCVQSLEVIVYPPKTHSHTQPVKLDDIKVMHQTESANSKTVTHIQLDYGQNPKHIQPIRLDDDLRVRQTKSGCRCSKSSPGINGSTTKQGKHLCVDSKLNSDQTFKYTQPIKLNTNLVKNNSKPGCHCSKSRPEISTKITEEMKLLYMKKDTKPGCHCSKSKPDITTSSSKIPHHVCVDSCLYPSKDSNVTNIAKPGYSKSQPNIGTTTYTIKIPIKLMLSIKNSKEITSAKSIKHITSEPDTHQPIIQSKRQTPSVKLLMNTHCNTDYVEPYMDELLDEGDDFRISIPTIQSCYDMYAEGYIKEGYSASHEDVEIQTDLALGPKLLSPSLNSIGDEEYFTGDEEHDGPEDSASRIQWEDVILPPKGTVQIAQAEKEESEIEIPEIVNSEQQPPAEEKKEKKKKKKGWSSCCGGEDEEEEEEPYLQPEIKLSFVYGKHCRENEQYTQSWLRGHTLEDKSESPCSSKPEIPWPKLILQKNAKIRVMSKPKLPEKRLEKPVASSSPCICGNRLGNERNFEKPVTPVKSTVTFSGNELVTLYPAPIPSVKLKVVSDKSVRPLAFEHAAGKAQSGTIITRLSGRSVSDHGKMKTKITLSAKDLQRLMDSEGNLRSMDIKQNSMHRKIISTKICPSNEIKAKSSYSTPLLPTQGQTRPQPPCGVPRCTDLVEKPNKQSSSTSLVYKQDPVVTALIACEAELKPVKQALNKVQQKLRNLNMPELDSLFNKPTQLADDFVSNRNTNSYKINIETGFRSGFVNPMNIMNDRSTNYYMPPSSSYRTSRQNRDNIENTNFARHYQPIDMYKSSGQYQNMGMPHTARQNQNMERPYQNQRNTYHNMDRPHLARPYQNMDNYHYYSFPSQSYSQSSACTPSSHNFNYNMDFLLAEEHFPSKSTLRKAGEMQHKKVSYKNDYYSPDSQEYFSEYSPSECCCCCCSPSQYDNRKIMKRSDDEISYTSSTSRSEDSIPKRKKSKKTKRKRKSKISKEESKVSVCPFLEAIKSIMTVDNKKVTKKGPTGLCYDTELSTKNIKNMRMHMRVRSSKKKSIQK